MNRFARLLLLVVSLFTVAFTTIASADTTPNVSVTVCVGLQGSRNTGQDEPVAWSLYDAGTSTVAYSDSSGGTKLAVINTPPSTKGCFETIGMPNTTYDLYIKGADHLGKKVTNWSYPATSIIVDLSSTVTLLEGDANNDNQVNFLDLIIFAATFNKSGTAMDPRGNFNEDAAVNFLDLIPFAANWSKQGE